MTSQKGFTLIELLLIIAVLGVLSAVSIPRVTGIDDKARDAAISSVAASIRSSMEAHHQEFSSYPTNTDINNWDDLDSELDTLDMGPMEDYNIGTAISNISGDAFSYSGGADNYEIKVVSNSTGKIYVITNTGFSEE